MSLEETKEYIKKLYCAPCYPNLEKYLNMYEYYEETKQMPDECNCFFHSYDGNYTNMQENLNITLLPFIKYIDNIVDKRENKEQLTLKEIKDIAKTYQDENISFKNANFNH